MSEQPDPLESLWDDLLSRHETSVRGAFSRLTYEEQQAVLAHLARMASEPGWHPEQRASAQAALDILAPPPGTSEPGMK